MERLGHRPRSSTADAPGRPIGPPSWSLVAMRGSIASSTSCGGWSPRQGHVSPPGEISPENPVAERLSLLAR